MESQNEQIPEMDENLGKGGGGGGEDGGEGEGK